MNTYLLSLGFLTPAFFFAGSLVMSEMRDPLGEFHEKYNTRRRITRKVSTNSSKKLDAYPKKFADFGSDKNYDSYSKGLDYSQTDSKKFGVKNNLVRIFALEVKRSRLYVWWVFCFFMLIMTKSVGGIILITGMSIVAFLLLQRNQKSRAKSKEQRIGLELPAIVELFAILISCGESPGSALIRLEGISVGEFSAILSEGVLRLRAGAGLIETLDEISAAGKIPELRRFCDSLIIAIQRGTSLSELLFRQVVEIRTKHHARMIESAGKAEIALMIPVVFLILPVSVLFALWPSFVSLSQSGAF